jgi:hypothetical protein
MGNPSTPAPDPVVPIAAPPAAPPSPRPDRRRRLLPLFVAIAAVCVLGGILTVAVVRARSAGEEPPAAAAAPPATTSESPAYSPPPTTVPVTTETGYSTEQPSPPTTEETADATDGLVPEGFRTVSGPAGIQVAIPLGWPVKPGAVPSNRQADALSGGGLVRFGGSPATGMSLYDTVAGNETANPNIIDGYQRLRLEPVYGFGVEAVDWEFNYFKDGELRHGQGRYWRLGGVDYVVYASAPETSWPPMISVIDTMIATAQPV